MSDVNQTMPLYQSHKTVRALEIAEVVVVGQKRVVHFKDDSYEPVTAAPEMFARYTPVAGDFYVVYADGYKSFSPGHAFVDGYARVGSRSQRSFRVVEGMTFGEAIGVLKAGHRVARAGWNGKGMWLALQVPDAHSKMSLPYIYMKTADGKLVPWLASQTDVLSDDWGQLAAPAPAAA